MTTTPSTLDPKHKHIRFPNRILLPPFFTLQPSSSIPYAPSLKWSLKILSYCRHHCLLRLSISTSLDSPLFYNRCINKRLGRRKFAPWSSLCGGEDALSMWLGTGRKMRKGRRNGRVCWRGRWMRLGRSVSR
ncbi:hypothetical protein BGZ57DRAFT_832458 [Hyaloscypha finlandica]|nr:hypothetical protein BGZ57DRAFT_832458 [Hyaloscypha finlandica]